MTAGPHQSAPAFSIQPAQSQHAAAIRNLVISSGINPTGLAWKRFTVALTPKGELIGCAQVKLHGDGTRELASLATQPAWRHRGVARALIQDLLAGEHGDVYLMCQSHLGPLYERFGFHSLSEEQMPTYFRRVRKLAGVLENLRIADETLLVMLRPAGS